MKFAEQKHKKSKKPISSRPRPRFLITAGPTREFIDDVRYISNRSSGRMGIALVDAARAAGAKVIFVCGPIELPAPKCDEFVPVVSADEMREEVLRHAAHCDAVLMAAAVADFRPARKVKGKIKKTGRGLALRLEPTPDILAELGRRKSSGQILAGFALEARNARANALAKLRAKNLDLIVLNSPVAMGADRADAEIIFSSSASRKLRLAPKKKIATAVVVAVLGLMRKQD